MDAVQHQPGTASVPPGTPGGRRDGTGRSGQRQNRPGHDRRLNLKASTAALKPSSLRGGNEIEELFELAASPFRGSAARAYVIALLALLLLAAAPTVPAQAGPQRPDTVVAEIDQFLNAALAESAIPGAAIAVTRHDQVLMVRGYGHDSTGEAVTGDSLFRIASLSKSITALAVMQLVEAGLLHLDDRVQDHLPEFQLDDPRADQITVRQLLDHSSGLSDAVVAELSQRQPKTTTEATTSLRSARLATAPGTSFSYHNPNYRVAARLVEVVSGESFDQYQRNHIFKPAGMTATTSTVIDDQPVPGLAGGHLIAYGQAVPAPGLGTFSSGDGGVVSSAADMARWLIVNSNEGQSADGTQVVSEQGLRVLHTPSAPASGYALGWGTYGPAAAPNRLEHSGSLFTFTAEQALWPAAGYGVVLLFNSGSPMMLDQTAIVHGVFDIIEGSAPPSDGLRLAATLDTILAVVTVAALTMGVAGVVRADRWTRRRRSTRLRRVLSLLPAVTVLGAGAAFPYLAEAWIQRDVAWGAAAYQWPALVVFVLTAMLAAAATLIARAWRWRRANGADPHRDQPAQNAPTGSAGGDPGYSTGVSGPVPVQARQQ